MTLRGSLPAFLRLGGALFVAAVAETACGNAETEPTCLSAPVNLDCQGAYGLHNGTLAPTFDEVFTNTLQAHCGVAGCHIAPNPQAGLELDQIDTAYQDLLSKSSTGEPRVTKGDVKCGKVIVRLESVGKPWSMPPGDHLDDPTLCSIAHWIAEGAPR